MRVFSVGGLLAVAAAAVLLGLATFGVPINNNYYLLQLGLGQADFHFGPFGYSFNGRDSATKLGYDVPRELGEQNPVSSLVHTLSYVLVLYPIGASHSLTQPLRSPSWPSSPRCSP